MSKSKRTRRLPSGLTKRGETYYANFKSNGRHIRRKLSRDLATAKVMLNELRSRADKSGMGVVDNKCSWADLRAEFIEYSSQRLRTWKMYVRHLDRFEKFRHVGSVNEINMKFALDYRRWRLKQSVTARTVNKEIATLQSMLNKAVKWEKIARNPISTLEALEHIPTKKRRALTVEEVEAIFEHSPPHLRLFWQMFMTTGIRHGELVGLKFSDINFDDGTMTIRQENAKGKKPRQILLDENVLTQIAGLKRQAPLRQANYRTKKGKLSRDHVFVNGANAPYTNNLLREFYGICEKAGIEGASPKAVQEILGHATLEMTMKIYAKASDRSKRDAISALPFANAKTPDHVVPMQRKRATG